MSNTLSTGFRSRARAASSTTTDDVVRTVLFVDDEPEIVASLADLFRGRYHVVTAASGEQALAMLPESGVAVVVSDQRMPTMTGAELLERVAAFDPDITRVMVTGYADIEAVIHLRPLGMPEWEAWCAGLECQAWKQSASVQRVTR